MRRTIQAFNAELLDGVICGWVAQQTGAKPVGGRWPAIAVDGKVVRGAWRPDGSQVNLLSAISHDTAVVLAQREIAAKTNEIPELPTLLADLDLTGVVVSADALHTQRETARHLVAHYVLTEGYQVVAYYAWCMAQVQPDKATERLRKGAGRYPQPVALLARLGVDTGHEGKELGVGLLQDVFARLLELSADIGCRGLIVHAASPAAREFYLHLVPEFEPSPTDDFHLLFAHEGDPWGTS